MPNFETRLDLIISTPVTKKAVRDNIQKTHGVYFWFANQHALQSLGIPATAPQLYTLDAGSLHLVGGNQIVVNNGILSEPYYLVYIGLGPSSVKVKKQFLKQRIANCHLGNYITNSTFRQSLSSLLEHNPFLHQVGQRMKIFVDHQDEHEITQLITNNFVLGVKYDNAPWLIEGGLIAEHEPPINLQGNGNGWFHGNMQATRANHRALAALDVR
jgi:hypothetical protein